MALRPAHGWLDTVLYILLTAIALLVGSVGIVFHVYGGVIILLVLAGLVNRVVGLLKKDLLSDLVRRPLAPELRWHRIQLAVRVAFLAGWFVVAASTLAIAERISNGAQLEVLGLMLVIALFWLLLALFPRRTIGITGNVILTLATATAIVLGAWSLFPLPEPEVTLEPPFCRRMIVVQGGGDVLSNYHYATRSQRHAIDFVLLDDNGLMARDEAEAAADYACFGAPIHAPVAGEVVTAVRDRADQVPGAMDLLNPLGNHIVLRMDDGRYLLLAHFRRDSLAVEAGDRVAAGERLGECGNSGASSMPHLHIQVQSGPDVLAGVETSVMGFSRLGTESPRVLRRGDIAEAGPEAACRRRE